MRVFVLTAEAKGGRIGFDGTTSVHATQESAVQRFDDWLEKNQIDRGAVHYADVKLATFLGGDPDPDTLEGIEIHWGINEMEVHP